MAPTADHRQKLRLFLQQSDSEVPILQRHRQRYSRDKGRDMAEVRPRYGRDAAKMQPRCRKLRYGRRVWSRDVVFIPFRS